MQVQLRRDIQLDRSPLAAAGIVHVSVTSGISLSFFKYKACM